MSVGQNGHVGSPPGGRNKEKCPSTKAVHHISFFARLVGWGPCQVRQRASPCVCQEASKWRAASLQPLAPRLKTPNPMIETLLLPLKTRFHTGRKGIPNSAMECHRKQMSDTSSIVAVKPKSLGHLSNGHRKCATWVASSLYHAAPWAELILTFYRQRRHFHVSGYPRYRSTKGSARNPELRCGIEQHGPIAAKYSVHQALRTTHASKPQMLEIV